MLGYPLAYALVRSSNVAVKSFILIVTVTPLFLGEVVRTYSWIVVLGNNGFVNSLLLQARHHRTAAAAAVHGDRRHHRAGACDPAGRGRSCWPRPSRISTRDYEKAAESLGAGPVRVFLTVTLPLSAPGIVAGADDRLRLDLQRVRDAAAGRRRQGQHGVEPRLPARLCEFQFPVRGEPVGRRRWR